LKRIVVIALLSIAASPLALNQKADKKASDAVVRESIVRLNREWNEALVRRDVASLDRVLNDDFVFTGPTGRLQDKTQYIKSIQSSDRSFASFDTVNLEMRIYGHATVVTGRAVAKILYKNEERINHYRYTDVWIKRQTQWRAVARQATPIDQR
jgi:ketosteroid isomerase-like protein